MNEFLFILHCGCIFLFTVGALRLGKEALSTWICMQALFANIFVLKQIVLWELQVTASDVFAVGGILGLNLMQEFYGKESCKKVSLASLYCLLVFTLLSIVHLLYIPSKEDITHLAYATLLKPAPRLVIASLSVFFLIQQMDIRVFSKLRSSWTKTPFIVRNIFSLCLSQLLDTVLFTFLGLYGLVSSVYDVIVISFITKVIIICLLSPISLFIKRNITSKHVL